MKKVTVMILAAFVLMSLVACIGDGRVPEMKPGDGEMMLNGRITKAGGSYMLLETDESSISNKFSFSYSDTIEVVENGAFVVDLSADSFVGKDVSIICSELVQETYPAGLIDVRMIIIV